MFITPMMPLITLAKAEDPKKGALLEHMILAHQNRLKCIAYKIVKNEFDAEDVLQNTWQKVWTHFDDFIGKPDNDIIALLTTYTQNTAKDFLKSKNAKKNQTISLTYYDDEETMEYEIPDSVNLEEIVISKELAEKFGECIKKLPEFDRQLLALRYHYHYSSKKIAEVLNINVGNVDVKMSRAKAKLYKMMEVYLNGNR